MGLHAYAVMGSLLTDPLNPKKRRIILSLVPTP